MDLDDLGDPDSASPDASRPKDVVSGVLDGQRIVVYRHGPRQAGARHLALSLVGCTTVRVVFDGVLHRVQRIASRQCRVVSAVGVCYKALEMRIVPTLLFVLALALGTPVVAISDGVGDACAPAAASEGDTSAPCKVPGPGDSMSCGSAGGWCQASAVIATGAALPAEPVEVMHISLPSPHYRSPQLPGLYRPPITSAG